MKSIIIVAVQLKGGMLENMADNRLINTNRLYESTRCLTKVFVRTQLSTRIM